MYMDFNNFYQLRFLFLLLLIGCKSFNSIKSYKYNRKNYSIELKILNKKDAALILTDSNGSDSKIFHLKYTTKIYYINSYENKTFKPKNNKIIKYLFDGSNINCIKINDGCMNFSEGVITAFSEDLLFKDFSMKIKPDGADLQSLPKE